MVCGVRDEDGFGQQLYTECSFSHTSREESLVSGTNSARAEDGHVQPDIPPPHSQTRPASPACFRQSVSSQAPGC